MNVLSTAGPCTAMSMWLEQAHCSLFGSCQTSITVSGTEFKVKASVVIVLHLHPVSNPILFLGLLRLKS